MNYVLDSRMRAATSVTATTAIHRVDFDATLTTMVQFLRFFFLTCCSSFSIAMTAVALVVHSRVNEPTEEAARLSDDCFPSFENCAIIHHASDGASRTGVRLTSSISCASSVFVKRLVPRCVVDVAVWNRHEATTRWNQLPIAWHVSIAARNCPQS